MNRLIQWNSGCFDEIELVYEKAAEDSAIAELLEKLERGALEEAKAGCGIFRRQGRSVSPQEFDGLPEDVKETMISLLGRNGIASFDAPLSEPKITVRFTGQLQQLLSCTAFSLLNRLEKLDGAFNALHPKATLELQVPPGQRKGLFLIEMLILRLYPWLSVSTVAAGCADAPSAQTAVTPPPEVPEVSPAPQNPEAVSDAPAKEKKPGFWSRMFGKKTSKTTQG